MPAYVRTRLSAMMFLFYFAMGSWAVTLSTYLMSAPVKGGLNFTTGEVGWVYSTFAIGGVTAPLFIGLLADRLFAVERILGVSGVVCSVLLFAAGRWCDSRFPVVDAAYRAAAAGEVVDGRPVLEQFALLNGDDALREPVRLALDRVNDDPAVRSVATDTFRPLFALMLGVNFCVQLGLTLCAVMSLRNLADPPRQFSRTRMVGTVGWVAAGLCVAVGGIAVSSGVLYLSAAAALAFGLFAFTLPHTPPKGHGKTLAEAFGVPALRLFRDRSFCVFVFCGFVASAMNQFYGVYAHRYLTDLRLPRPELILTMGQVTEVACMFAIPLLNPKKWMKALMLLGLVGWVLRSTVLAAGWVPAVVGVGVPMHGWSFAFYFVVAATYIDREAPPHLRASAQAIVSFNANGAAPWAGNMLAAFVVDRHRAGTVVDWQPVWLVPLAGSAVGLIVFLLFFRPPREKNP
jgi:nucleoside transporter